VREESRCRAETIKYFVNKFLYLFINKILYKPKEEAGIAEAEGTGDGVDREEGRVQAAVTGRLAGLPVR
jgi:hypothetical protein